jgi:kinetochore protein NNF1
MPSADMEKSPSPPPAPPTQQTPGPRATAFINLYTSALDSTLKSISYPSFAACFPSIAQNAPTQLAAMHTGMTNGFKGFAMGEFETIMLERGVVEKLNSLEDLIGEARKRKSRAVEGERGGGDVP